MSFIIDNFGYIAAAVGLYVGGCYTPRTYDGVKAKLLAWVSKKF